MTRFLIVGAVGGVLFAILDGLISANPLAQKLYSVYKPIARPSARFLAGIVMDLVYGFTLKPVT